MKRVSFGRWRRRRGWRGSVHCCVCVDQQTAGCMLAPGSRRRAKGLRRRRRGWGRGRSGLCGGQHDACRCVRKDVRQHGCCAQRSVARARSSGRSRRRGRRGWREHRVLPRGVFGGEPRVGMQGGCIPLKPRRLGLRCWIVPRVRRVHAHNHAHNEHHAEFDGNLHSDQLPHHH